MAPNPNTLSPVTIVTAGTRVRITTLKCQAATLLIEADSLNTGNIYWGDSTVSATNGNTIPSGQSATISFEGGLGTSGTMDICNIYLDADTSGNKARITYFA